jgi:3'-5' exoribonuclease
VVQSLKKVSEDTVDLADFMPVSKRSLVEMRAELDLLLDSMTDGPFGQLMRAFFADAEFFKLYSRAPAAKGMHHVFLGGLLEHSLAVSALACDIAKRYPQVDRDLLIAGALMHDVGKIAELSYERSFDYTDEGKLIGHIVMGVEMIEERSRTIPNFPRQQAMLLKHMLLSHHGQYEYGSPKRPKILEAVILSFIDDLDSKINGIQTHIDKEPDRTGDWTSYHRLYDRYFYAPLEPQDPAIIEETAPVLQHPETPEPAKVHRSRNEPLGFTLGEKLAGQNLPLFGSDKKDKK